MIKEFKGEYRFLSNFWPCMVKVDGIVYPTSEHAYQASKTNNTAIKYIIADQSSPAIAKRMGRLLDIDPSFQHEKVYIMKKILEQKFSDTELKKKLVDTGNEKIIEGNTWHDNFWGSCVCDKCRNKGRNVLGILLMDIRYNVGI